MDTLTLSYLEDTLRLEKKRASTTEEDWDKMNRQLWLDQVLSDTRYQVSCVTLNICKAAVGGPGEKSLTKSVESLLELKSKLYHF